MVAIRQIIAFGCLLSLAGCGSRLPYVGDWVATQNLPPGPETPADTTLKEVDFQVDEDGKFVLIMKSVPLEGRMDLTAKTQLLDVEYILGKSVQRSGAKVSITTTWNDDGTIGLSDGSGLSIVLHRKPKPSAG